MAPRSAADIRAGSSSIAGFSPSFEAADREIKRLLFRRVYRDEKVMRMRAEADGILRDLFTHFFAAPDLMPAEWGEGLDGADDARRARRIADYIAGMTDRYAAAEHSRLTGRNTTPGEMG
jgi:dGTPase